MLLAEDDDADAYLITSVLTRHPKVGFVMRARDGVEALQMIDNCSIRPHLAIIDLHMPRKNGFALLLELACREDFHFPNAVLTSSVASIDEMRSKLRGADYFLTKPESVRDLETQLSQVIASV
ncbi:response regulator [Phenylobacterium sp.]|uniref:response regulator n=1 Tax=Phenylobacterium sp. TaxID=1871053 RepID=UPI0035B27AB5